jgi:2-oxoglutarate dehydrogenase E2 component (dihydrolipoamide succinyltransferase)
MLTTFQEVDMGPLMDMRNKHKDEFEKKHGVKLGFMSAFVKVGPLHTADEMPLPLDRVIYFVMCDRPPRLP